MHTVALLFLALASTVCAQGLSTSISGIHPERFPEIHLTLTVFSEHGRPVPGLSRDAFTITENGAAVAVKSVDLAKSPLSVALVLDTSSSMQPALEALKEAARTFVRGLEDGDTVAVIGFGSEAKLVQERTGNRDKVKQAIDKLLPAGATAFFDAIHVGLEELRPVDRRRLVLAFTDGRDQNLAGTAPQSARSAKSVAKEARDASIPIWAIGLGADVDRELLARLTRATGGASYFPKDAGTIRAAFSRALTDVRLSYQIVYTTPNTKRDGAARMIAVQSAHQGKTGQGHATYMAPAPAPKLAANPSGGGSPAAGRPIAGVAFQSGQVHLRGWRSMTWYDVYRPLNNIGDRTHVTYGYVTSDGSKSLELPPGEYVIVLKSSDAELGESRVKVVGGGELLIAGPLYQAPSAPIEPASTPSDAPPEPAPDSPPREE